MSMYTVCGRVFYGNDLYHGLGKGSGRGRPKGSRNGYIMPGAAYMKGYEIKGDPREGVVEYGRVDRSEMRKNAQIQKRSQPSRGGVIDKSGNKLREGMRLRASNAVSSGVSSRKVDNAPTQTTRTKAPQGHGAAAATARGRELMTNLDAGNPYNMHSDPYSGRGAAANEPDGYNMHSDPYENVQGTAAENTHSESWWETLGRGLSGVASRIKNLAVRAIDTGKKAFNDARNWVSNALAPVGRLAKTAYNAAAKWVGDRARDLDRWWNGYDVQVNQGNRSIQDTNGQNAVTTTHVSGAKDRIRQGVNQAGRAINEGIFGRETVAPYDMHNDVTTPYTPQRVRVGGLLGQGGTVDQARDYIQGVPDRVDTAVSNFQNQVARNPVVRAAGEAINGAYDMHSDPYGDAQYNGGVLGENGLVDQARDYIQSVPDRVDAAASNFQNQIARNPLVRATGEAINGIYDMHSDPYGDAQYNGGVLGENGLVDQAGRLVNRGVNAAENAVLGTPTYNMLGDPYADPQTVRRGGVFGSNGLVDQGVGAAGRLWNQGVQGASNVASAVSDLAQRYGDQLVTNFRQSLMPVGSVDTSRIGNIEPAEPLRDAQRAQASGRTPAEVAAALQLRMIGQITDEQYQDWLDGK